MWRKIETQGTISVIYSRDENEDGGEDERRFLFVLLVFWRPLPMLRYVTAILNDDGAASSSVVSHFAVALTGKSGFRVHARCAMPRTGASRTIINCTCARALWAAELRKFSNCR